MNKKESIFQILSQKPWDPEQAKIDDLHKLANALLISETLDGKEIKNLILKNIQPTKTVDKKDGKEEESSALGSLGLKPKPAH